MPFSNYDFVSATPLYEGQLASNSLHNIRSYTNNTNAVIPFGRALVQDTLQNSAKIATAISGVFLGVSLAVEVYEATKDSSGVYFGGFPPYREMSVLTQGDVAVYVEQAVTVTDPVFFRHTANGSNQILGVFRKDADTLTGGSIASITVGTAGSGYTTAPNVAFSGGSGSGATATAVIATNTVAAIAITNGGTGYSSAPTLAVTGGGGSGATATCTVSGGVINAVTITNAGTGYVTAPTITVTGAGTGAVLTATLGGGVTGVIITNAGTGYSSAPTISFSGGGGTSAAATATVSSSVATADQVTSARWVEGAPAGGIAILSLFKP